MRYRATASFSADGENEGHEVQGGEDGHYRYRDCHYSLTHSLSFFLLWVSSCYIRVHLLLLFGWLCVTVSQLSLVKLLY